MKLTHSIWESIFGNTEEMDKEFDRLLSLTKHAYSKISENIPEYQKQNIKYFAITGEHVYVLGHVQSPEADLVTKQEKNLELKLREISKRLDMEKKFQTVETRVEYGMTKSELEELGKDKLKKIIQKYGRKQDFKKEIELESKKNERYNTITAVEELSKNSGSGILYLPASREAIDRLNQNLRNFVKEPQGLFFSLVPKSLSELQPSRYGTIQ